MYILLGVLAVVNLVLIGLLVLRGKQSGGDSLQLLKSDLTHLSDQVGKLHDGVQQQLSQSLDKSQESMGKQLASSAQLIKDVTDRLAKLDETNRRVVDVADELKTLQNIMMNPKQRGAIGEYYLHTVLSNVLPPSGFKLQYKFKDGEIVDAVVMLDKGRLLPVDSKFSLENYNRLVEAKDKTAQETIAKQFKIDLKNRIDETSKYIRPSEQTMDYAFMFIPSEAVYYDLLINKVGETRTSARDLLEYAFRDKHVIIVSPTTFMAYLQTVMQGLRSLQIEEQAKDIQQRVGELARHLGAFETYMQKLGSSLGTTVGHFNTAHKELGKIDKDVVRIADTSSGIEPLQLEKPHLDD